MITHRGRRAIATVLFVLAAAACTAVKQENIPTTTTESPRTTTWTATTTQTAPPVTKPLDAREFVADPCASITTQQQSAYSITRTERQPADVEGESCFFYRTKAAFSVSYATDVSTGLDHLYQQHGRGAWVYWRSAEADGYPAIAYSNMDPPYECYFAVGINDTLYFSVSVSGDKTCTESNPIASTVLANIKATN